MVTIRFATLRAQITLSTSIGLVIGGFLVAAAPNYDSGQAPSLTAEITQIIGSVRKTDEVATITAVDGPKQVPEATWYTPVAPTTVESVTELGRTATSIADAPLPKSATPTVVSGNQGPGPAFESVGTGMIALFTGPLGIALSLTSLLVGLGTGVMRQTPMPALLGLMVATMVSLTPKVLPELLQPQHSPQGIIAAAPGVVPQDASVSSPLSPPPDSTPKR